MNNSTGFAQSETEKRPAFLPFIMAGYPNYEQTIRDCLNVAESGADIIELGFPYSDPLADGPVLCKRLLNMPSKRHDLFQRTGANC